MRTEILSGLTMGDTIRAMYITLEGMNNAGISTQQQTLELEDLQQNNMRNMSRQYGGGGPGGGNTSSRGGGGTTTTVMMVR